MIKIRLSGCNDDPVIYTPSSVGNSLPQGDVDYEPDITEVSSQEVNWKREFRKWLSFTGYNGRWRSTDNYQSLNRHEQTNFRRQVKGILRHILHQLAQNDVDAVWEDLMNEELKTPNRIKDG